MRFRATLASLLTVMLLSFSCLASTCEIKCDLKSVLPGCDGTSMHAEKQHHPMPAMAGMDRHSPSEVVTPSSEALASSSQSCAHHVCAQSPALLSEQKAVIAHVLISAGGPVSEPPAVSSQEAIGAQLVRGPPPFRLATPVSLHTTLLI